MTRSASNIYALGTFPPSFRGRVHPPGAIVRNVLGLCLMLLCSATASALTPPQPPLAEGRTAMTPNTPARTAPAPAPSAASIQHVSLERDCHGCASAMRLELPRGGPAVAHRVGKARHRTADSSTSAALPAAEFDALARALVAAGFFAMAATYEDETLADGAWTRVTVRHADGEHSVFRREDAGPEALKALEASLDALMARLHFMPDRR